MADAGGSGSGSGNSGTSLRGMREQLVAAAHAVAEERRNQSGSAAVLAQPSNIRSSTKPVIDGSVLRSDERQRLARERREEREKQYAFKETQLLEKEKKARLQYEKQLEERQRKIKEQKLKEQQRRAAAEEKRRQKLDEEKEHYEAMVNRTLERSNRLEQRQKRWSRGGSVTPDSDSKSGLLSASPPNPVDLVDKLPSSTEPQTAEEGGSSGNRCASSPMNLKQTDSIINKRLSSSSATLPSSDKTRRFQISALETSIINRLLTPTQASLAKIKSAAVLSAAGKDPSAASSTISCPAQAPRKPMRSRSIDRPKTSVVAVSTNATGFIQKSEVDKYVSTHTARRAPSPSLSARKRSPSPANIKHPPSPSTSNRPTQGSRPPSPVSAKQQQSSPTCVLKPALKPIQRPLITPTVTNITKKSRIPETDSKPKDTCEENRKHEQRTSPASEKERVASAGKTKEEPSSKTGAGSTCAEEAAKILVEKLQLARELREREEWERCQKEEERKVKENIEKKATEDEEKREAEFSQLEETRSLEEQQRKTEEGRAQEQEHLAELQQQKEEAEAKAQEEAERQRRERERIMEQSIQERLERKKRIEEIMKRTRKVELNSEQSEEKSKNAAVDEDAAHEGDEGRFETADAAHEGDEGRFETADAAHEGDEGRFEAADAAHEGDEGRFEAADAAHEGDEGRFEAADAAHEGDEGRFEAGDAAHEGDEGRFEAGDAAHEGDEGRFEAGDAAHEGDEGRFEAGDASHEGDEGRFEAGVAAHEGDGGRFEAGDAAHEGDGGRFEAADAAHEGDGGRFEAADAAHEGDEGRSETADPPATVTEIDSSENDKTSEGLSAETFPKLAYTEKAEAAAGDEVEGLVTDGDEMATEPENRDCLPVTLATDPRLSAKDMITPNLQTMDVDETDNSSNLNGKSSTWTCKEIIELGIHAKSIKLNSSNTPSESCTQNSNDAATFVPGPKLDFEEDAVMNSVASSEGSNSDL